MNLFLSKSPTLLAACAVMLAFSACGEVGSSSADETFKDDNIEQNSSGGDSSTSNSTSVSTTTNSDGTSSTSINSSNGNNSSSSSSSSSNTSDDGKFSLNVNGTDLSLVVPNAVINAAQNNNDLYPGAKITGVNVNANSNGNNGSSVVDINFTAPDEPNTVAEYFVKKFKDEGGSATQSGSTVTGKTKEKQDYTLTISPNGNGSRGRLSVNGSGQ